MESRYGSRARSSRVELETHYTHRVLSATENRAELEITIEALDLYYEDRHLGSVDFIPEHLGKIYATVYNDGEIRFDREVFVLGDPVAGFELISTQYYDGYVMDEYRSSDGYYAGRIDLRTGSVNAVSRSRFFDPYAASGYIPISVLPENEGWLWDFGADAISASGDNYDYYYGAASPSSVGLNGLATDPLRSSDEYEFRTLAGTDVLLQRETELQRVK